MYPDDGRDPEALIVLADRALYYGKQSGRNSIVMASRGRP